MNDLQMTKNGDLAIFGFDVHTTDSIEQEILIKLRWFFAEWVYNRSYGVKWFEKVLIKNPSKLIVRRMLEDAILSVDGVVSVQDMTLSIHSRQRVARISFKAITNQGKIDMMEFVPLGADADGAGIIATIRGRNLILKMDDTLCYVQGSSLIFTEKAPVSVNGTTLVIGGMNGKN